MGQIIPSKGDIIQLLEMNNDPFPIEPGAQGTVTFINDFNNGEVQIGVEWENGRRLFLIHPVDKFKIIKKASL